MQRSALSKWIIYLLLGCCLVLAALGAALSASAVCTSSALCRCGC